MSRAPESPGREFLRGLRSRHPLVLVAGLLLAGGLLLGLQHTFATGGFTRIPEDRLLRIPNDDYVHVSYRVAELKQRPPDGPALYLFGGSGAIELIQSEQALATAVTAAGGGAVEVVSLAAHSQSMGQTLALVDNLPPGPGLLAVGLSPNRLTKDPAGDAGQLGGRPLMIGSSRLAQVVDEAAGRRDTLPGLLPGMSDFVVSYVKARASGAQWFTPIPYAHHYYEDEPPAANTAKVRGARQELDRQAPLYAAYSAYNLAVLAEVVRLGRERGFAVVLFEQPLGPEASGSGWDELLARYRADVRALAGDLGVPYVDVTARAELHGDDFADLYHLLEPGRDKFQAVFARELAHLLPSLALGPVSR